MAEATTGAAAPAAVTPDTAADTSNETEISEADEAAAAAAAKPAAPAREKIKVDGKELELTPEELRKYASLGAAGQKRMEEAAQVRKENDSIKKDIASFFEMLRNDPLAILNDPNLGVDVKKLAERVINDEVERAKKSPEQLEKERLTKELEDAHKKIKTAEDGRKKEEFERLQNEQATQIERDINEAIDSNQLPKSPYVVRKMADLMLLATQQGIDLSAKDVVPIARKQMMEELRGMTGILPEDILEEILGNEKVANLRKRYINKVKAVKNSSDIKATAAGAKPGPKSQDKPKVAAKDFFKKLGSY